jgi:uncharacterized protein (DUF488 family)
VRAFTVGHSTHSFDAFVALLARHGVEVLADVRRTPRSGRHPQFNLESLAASLPSHAIDYRHLPALGGHRRPRPDSPNRGWENEAFQGYADHALTPEFAAGLDELCRLARERPAAVMCAEAPWWRCHRRLIADVLVLRGFEVRHLMPGGRLVDHEPPAFMVRGGDGLPCYPGS